MSKRKYNDVKAPQGGGGRGRATWTGAAIKQAREERGLTQRELALMLGVCERTVKKWEQRGLPEVGLARSSTLVKLFFEQEVRQPHDTNANS